MREEDADSSLDPVNSHQVGGDHYRSDYQHWDWVEESSLGYLEGCATKYIARWRKKNGVEDLRKAIHYIQKLIQLSASGIKNPPSYTRWLKYLFRDGLLEAFRKRFIPLFHEKQAEEFCKANGLGSVESEILELLASWENPTHLRIAESLVLSLIAEHDPATPVSHGNE